MGGQHHAPAAVPPGKTRYPLYRRLDGPQGLSERLRKISPPPGFDPRTVQAVVSRYTDWATWPRTVQYLILIMTQHELFLITNCMYVMSASEVRASNTITTDSMANLFLWLSPAPLTKTIKIIYMFNASCTVRSESRCLLWLRFVDLVQVCIYARGHHIQHIL
jgi:hypothetical protein